MVYINFHLIIQFKIKCQEIPPKDIAFFFSLFQNKQQETNEPKKMTSGFQTHIHL